MLRLRELRAAWTPPGAHRRKDSGPAAEGAASDARRRQGAGFGLSRPRSRSATVVTPDVLMALPSRSSRTGCACSAGRGPRPGERRW